MFVAYTAKIRGIIKCWQCYGVCEDYNGVVSKVLGDGWINPRILSVQSLEAHHRCQCLRNTEDIGPLFDLFSKVGVVESRITVKIMASAYPHKISKLDGDSYMVQYHSIIFGCR